MAAIAPNMELGPNAPSPLERTVSPFKNPRPAPPCTPARTAKLWDEYQERALENARRRDYAAATTCPPRSAERKHDRKSASNTPTRSSIGLKFRRGHVATPSTTVAICKTCKEPITYASGICELCTKKIVLPAPIGHTTPPPSPIARSSTSTDTRPHRRSSYMEESNMTAQTSPKRKYFSALSTQAVDPPIRLSSLQPPTQDAPIVEPARDRKPSVTDPNEAFMRLFLTHQPYQPRSSHPTTPTNSAIPTTPPSTAQSRSSTRPSSLANIASLPISAFNPNARKTSTTPSDFSTMYPYSSTTTASPPSLCRTSYTQQVVISAWDDWDSDEEEKVGLVGWMGRRKAKGKARESRRSGSKDSKDSFGSDRDIPLGVAASERNSSDKKSKARRSKDDERLEAARRETLELVRKGWTGGAKKKRPSGFVRVISCGACSDK